MFCSQSKVSQCYFLFIMMMNFRRPSWVGVCPIILAISLITSSWDFLWFSIGQSVKTIRLFLFWRSLYKLSSLGKGLCRSNESEIFFTAALIPTFSRST